jgi:trans-aconitate methyltransferase
MEYGCGVGRVTPHLAAMFSRLIGVDISASHLVLATQSVKRSGVANAELRLATPPDFGMAEPIDLWFSRLVLQHNPPPIMAMILRRMLSMLAPGAVAIFQLPTHAPSYRFIADEYLARNSDEIEMHCLPQSVIFALAAEAGCTPLEVREDDSMGYPWLSNVFVFRRG